MKDLNDNEKTKLKYMNDNQTMPPCDVTGGNFEAKSLADFIEQMKQLETDGWEICHIKAFVGVRTYPIASQQ